MNFWAVHGYFGGFFFILFLIFLPRITMFVTLVLSAGIVAWVTEPFGVTGFGAFVVLIVGWIAWFTVPRFLIAALATALYWRTDPILCIGAWLIAYITMQAKVKAAANRVEKRQQEQLKAERAKEERAARRSRRRTSDEAFARRYTQRPAPSTRQRAQQWWDVLGVNPTASAEAVKAAYRRVAKATHPDTAPDGRGDAEGFRKANEAYKQSLKRNND